MTGTSASTAACIIAGRNGKSCVPLVVVPSGKTTIARLLLGLYQPSSGRVLLDGIDVRLLDPAAYRRQVAVVLQENLLLRGTIAVPLDTEIPSWRQLAPMMFGKPAIRLAVRCAVIG